jgi:hypothetical protein
VHPAAISGGAIIGALGGMIGLGGAEFRLSLLIGVFPFAVLQVVILNHVMSLVVVASALPFRAGTSVEVTCRVAHALRAPSCRLRAPIALGRSSPPLGQ